MLTALLPNCSFHRNTVIDIPVVRIVPMEELTIAMVEK